MTTFGDSEVKALPSVDKTDINIGIKSSTSLLIFVVMMLLVFVMAARIPLDTDLWWHLRAGELSWQSGHPVLDGAFSYTKAGAPWINHSWLAQIGLYLLFRSGSYMALSGIVAVLAMLSMAFVYFQMEGPGILKSFGLILGCLAAAAVWTPRPQMATMVLIAVVGYLLFIYKWQHKNYLWLLLLIFILWSNLHGGYSLGLALIGLMIAGEVLNHLLGFTGEEILSWRGIFVLGLWGAGSILVVLINPNGINTWLVPFQTVGVQSLQKYVQEWASPDFHDLMQQPFLWLLFSTIAAIGLSNRRLDATDLLNLVGFGYLSLMARRNFGPFALVATPILSRHFWPALRGWALRISSTPKIKDWISQISKIKNKSGSFPSTIIQKTINLSIIGFLAIVAGVKLYIVSFPALVESYFPASFPVKAVDWIEFNHPEGNILNEYNWGGYLTWFARDYPVFVDGRTDLFGDKIIGEWINMMQAGTGWQQQLETWNIHLVLIQPDRPLVQALAKSGWQIAYRDNQAIILTKQGAP
jgi:hypothetical protein